MLAGRDLSRRLQEVVPESCHSPESGAAPSMRACFPGSTQRRPAQTGDCSSTGGHGTPRRHRRRPDRPLVRPTSEPARIEAFERACRSWSSGGKQLRRDSGGTAGQYVRPRPGSRDRGALPCPGGALDCCQTGAIIQPSRVIGWRRAPGAPATDRVWRRETLSDQKSRHDRAAPAHANLRMIYAAAGGYGDPQARDADALRARVRDGLASADARGDTNTERKFDVNWRFHQHRPVEWVAPSRIRAGTSFDAPQRSASITASCSPRRTDHERGDVTAIVLAAEGDEEPPGGEPAQRGDGPRWLTNTVIERPARPSACPHPEAFATSSKSDARRAKTSYDSVPRSARRRWCAAHRRAM